jgi:hypothetical protein
LSQDALTPKADTSGGCREGRQSTEGQNYGWQATLQGFICDALAGEFDESVSVEHAGNSR